MGNKRVFDARVRCFCCLWVTQTGWAGGAWAGFGKCPLPWGKTGNCKGLLSKERGYYRAEPQHSPAGRTGIAGGGGGSFPSQFLCLSHDGSRGEGTFTAAAAGLRRGSAPGTNCPRTPQCPALPLLPSHTRCPALPSHLSRLLAVPTALPARAILPAPAALAVRARCPSLPALPSQPFPPMLPMLFLLFSLPKPALHSGSGPGSSSSHPVTVPGVTLPAQPALRHPVPPLESTGRAVASSASVAAAVPDPPQCPGSLLCRWLPDSQEPLVAPCPPSAPPGARPAPPSARGLAAGRRKRRAALPGQPAAGATWAAPRRTITLSSRVSPALRATPRFPRRGGVERQELRGGKQGALSPEPRAGTMLSVPAAGMGTGSYGGAGHWGALSPSGEAPATDKQQ